VGTSGNNQDRKRRHLSAESEEKLGDSNLSISNATTTKQDYESVSNKKIFFIKYLDYQAVMVETHYDNKGKKRDRPLIFIALLLNKLFLPN
jgi:hypothetical protein